MSLTFVEDELGVAALEAFGDRESAPGSVVEEERGDAVPEDESFFLEDLFESFALDNCSCWTSVSWSTGAGEKQAGEAGLIGKNNVGDTYHSLPEAFHVV